MNGMETHELLLLVPKIRCSTVGVGAVLGWRIRIFRFCLITTIEEQGSTGKAGDLVRH